MNEYVYSSGSQPSFNKYIAKVFGLMFMGLMVTALSAFFTYASGLWMMFVRSGFMMFVPMIVEVGIVMFMSARLHTMTKGGSIAAFMLYSLVTGITFSTYLLVFGGAKIFIAFAFTAIVFGCMAIIGLTTTLDLSKYSSMFRVGLISLIVGGIFNMFAGISMFDFVLCYAGLFIFLGLTAYDMQTLRTYYQNSMYDDDLSHKLAVMAALNLYLDFINIFVHVLSILARNQQDN